MAPPTVVSLFSGCGGFDSGFAESGFDILGAYDKDPVAVHTYNANHRPIAKQRNLGIEAVDSSAADVVIAGPPCQGFSTVGKHRPQDDRNSLFAIACRLALEIKPKVLILENVPGVTQPKHADLLNEAMGSLQAAGYFLSERILECENHGVPQRRRRFFLVARSGGRPFDFAIRTSGPTSLTDAISKFVDDAPELALTSKAAQIARHIRPGQKLSNVRISPSSIHTWQIPDVFGATTAGEREILERLVRLRRSERVRDFGDADPVPLERLEASLGRSIGDDIVELLKKSYIRKVGEYIDLKNTFNGKYRRLSWGAASPTVDTRFGQPQLFLHPSKNRGLTTREAASIQGFPEDFILPPNSYDAYRLIGNAVPPPVASKVAELVREII